MAIPVGSRLEAASSYQQLAMSGAWRNGSSPSTRRGSTVRRVVLVREARAERRAPGETPGEARSR